jgi:hypothetical protein
MVQTATNRVLTATMLASCGTTPSSSQSPMPYQLKIRSVNTPPVMIKPKVNANSVALGIKAVRTPCFPTAWRRVSLLARAMRV